MKILLFQKKLNMNIVHVYTITVTVRPLNDHNYLPLKMIGTVQEILGMLSSELKNLLLT